MTIFLIDNKIILSASFIIWSVEGTGARAIDEDCHHVFIMMYL